MGLMSEDRLSSEVREPGSVRPDRRSEESFEALAEIITGELVAGGGPFEDRLATADGARGVAELIAVAVLDRFVLRSRPAEHVRDHVSREAVRDHVSREAPPALVSSWRSGT